LRKSCDNFFLLRAEIAVQAIAILECLRSRPFLGFTYRPGRKETAGSKAPGVQEDAVKELSVEEVLRIAGGVPVSAALDELTYRAPQEAAGEPIDYAHLINATLRPSEPT
jgi:hypothetical protein